VTTLAVALLGSVIGLTPDSSFGQINSTRSKTFGGSNGGSSFDDSHNIGAWGRIRQIVVRHGNEVDSIGVFWANGNFFTHGGTGGTATVINLNPDEFISRVEGRSGDRLDQITFRSNKRAYGPFGGGGGSPFTVDFSGKALHYLFGRSGAEIDQIGFGFGDQPPALPTTIGRSGEHGGTGGNDFDDLQSAGTVLGKIKSITVRHGLQVDNIAPSYDGYSGSTAHGGGGGTSDTFTLDDNEWLTEIRGRSGAQLDQVQFFTSSGRVSPVYGGNGGNPFIERKDNSIIKAFFGRSGQLIDQLGVYFDDAKPTSIEVTSIHYDIGALNVVQQPPLAVLSQLFVNKGSLPQQSSETKSFQTTDTSTTQTSETSELSVQMEFSSNFPVANTKWTIGFKQGVTYTTGSSHEEQNTLQVQFQTTVPPNSTMKGTCVIQQGVYNVPYTATAKVTYQNRPPMTMTLHGILKGVTAATSVVTWEPVQ
jgi:hypothetical protein